MGGAAVRRAAWRARSPPGQTSGFDGISLSSHPHAWRPEASPLPISSVNIRRVSPKASAHQATGTRRAAGSMVVSCSCSGFISPRPRWVEFDLPALTPSGPCGRARTPAPRSSSETGAAAGACRRRARRAGTAAASTQMCPHEPKATRPGRPSTASGDDLPRKAGRPGITAGRVVDAQRHRDVGSRLAKRRSGGRLPRRSCTKPRRQGGLAWVPHAGHLGAAAGGAAPTVGSSSLSAMSSDSQSEQSVPAARPPRDEIPALLHLWAARRGPKRPHGQLSGELLCRSPRAR